MTMTKSSYSMQREDAKMRCTAPVGGHSAKPSGIADVAGCGVVTRRRRDPVPVLHNRGIVTWGNSPNYRRRANSRQRPFHALSPPCIHICRETSCQLRRSFVLHPEITHEEGYQRTSYQEYESAKVNVNSKRKR